MLSRACFSPQLQLQSFASLPYGRAPTRHFTSAFDAPKPDNVRVSIGSSGYISLDIFHPPRPAHPTPVIINFPRGPLASRAPAPPNNLSPIAIASNLTVVQLHYRLSNDGNHYPRPIHDALAGYDWVVKHLASGSQSSIDGAMEHSLNQDYGKIGLCGELIGGGIAAALGLTECHSRRSGVRAMVLGNPVTDWASMHPILPDGQRPLANPPPPPKPRKRATTRTKKTPQTSWEAHALNPLLPSTELLKARTDLFDSAADYFDPFASPMLFFRTPNTEIPADIDPLDDLFAELDGVIRPTEKKRKSARKYPPLDSDLSMPLTRMWLGQECVLKDQGVELGKAMEKVHKDKRISVEKAEGLGLWGVEELMEIGRWLGYVLRS